MREGGRERGREGGEEGGREEGREKRERGWQERGRSKLWGLIAFVGRSDHSLWQYHQPKCLSQEHSQTAQ